MSDTPIVDAAAERGQHLGPGGNMLMSDIWNIARTLERDRAVLLKALECALELMAVPEHSQDAQWYLDQQYLIQLVEKMK